MNEGQRFHRVWIERAIGGAGLRTLERLVRLLAREQKLQRSPGWYFGIPDTRHDLGTFARELIWSRYSDNHDDRPIEVGWCRRLKLNLRLGNDLSWCVFVGGMYEPNELAFFATVLEHGMTVVDVGANDGLYSLVAASRVGEHGRVLAVEPSSREFGRLQANIGLNQLGNVEAIRLALYSCAGDTQLTRAEFGHEGQNTIGNVIVNPKVSAAGSEVVELQTLDGFVVDQAIDRLDVLKIDAEGSEAHVLKGGLEALRRLTPIILMEVAASHLAVHGSTTEELLGLLAEIGYRVWVFGDDGSLVPLSRDGELSPNIVAAPNGWQPPPVP